MIDFKELTAFMREFNIDFLNENGELIIDAQTNTYATINECESIEDVELRVVFNLCRPIGKGLSVKKANVLLQRLNKYFDAELTREDMRLMYRELCYLDKLEYFRSFIKKGFPINELEGSELK